jgi:uncharacterized protein YndB with AHSA1/START domain
MTTRPAADYRCTLVLHAPRTVVYDALTTPAGLTGWWTTDADVATTAGSQIRFNWSPTDHTTFRIDRLTPPTTLAWTCIAQHDTNLPHPDEWVGTTIGFELTDHDDGTQLTFIHHGLTPHLDCYDVCHSGWDHFLDQSLRAYVETGHGTPWTS